MHHEVTRRLLNDFNFKQKDSWLRQGVNPNCQKKELYTNADESWILHCGRLNKGAAEFHFIYENELYCFKIDLDRYSRAYENVSRSNEDLNEEDIKSKAIQEPATIISIANCNPTPLYFQENTVTDESWYISKLIFLMINHPLKIPLLPLNYPV